ncbi:MAG: YjbQ family protein [Deltaproteobacteria bacterium]|nr:YjbQ family protein [Deltaproteobacteria bacterium]
MEIKSEDIFIKTTGETDVIDITSKVKRFVVESGISNGIAVLFVPGSTAALTTIEFESGAVNDLKRAIEGMAPRDIYYEHNERWGDGNGYAHVRAAILGPSLHIPLTDGKLTLGTWQQIVLLDFDNQPRQRQVIIQLMGE